MDVVLVPGALRWAACERRQMLSPQRGCQHSWGALSQDTWGATRATARAKDPEVGLFQVPRRATGQKTGFFLLLLFWHCIVRFLCSLSP